MKNKLEIINPPSLKIRRGKEVNTHVFRYRYDRINDN